MKTVAVRHLEVVAPELVEALGAAAPARVDANLLAALQLPDSSRAAVFRDLLLIQLGHEDEAQAIPAVGQPKVSRSIYAKPPHEEVEIEGSGAGHPAFAVSLDGTRAAFACSRGADATKDIYLVDLATGQ